MNKAAVKRLNAPPVVRYDLKDCPFCGASPEIQFWHGGRPSKRLISCSNASCDVLPSVTGETEAIAISKWEKRAH